MTKGHRRALPHVHQPSRIPNPTRQDNADQRLTPNRKEHRAYQRFTIGRCSKTSRNSVSRTRRPPAPRKRRTIQDQQPTQKSVGSPIQTKNALGTTNAVPTTSAPTPFGAPTPIAFRTPPTFPTHWLEHIETQIKYKGYIEKEQAQAERMRTMQDLELPDDMEYERMTSLSMEANQTGGTQTTHSRSSQQDQRRLSIGRCCPHGLHRLLITCSTWNTQDHEKWPFFGTSHAGAALALLRRETQNHKTLTINNLNKTRQLRALDLYLRGAIEPK